VEAAVALCCASVTVFTYLQCLLTYIVHWQVMSGGKPTDALCLCEYDDVEGQRQHLMAACCDCEALDVACDRCSLYSIDSSSSIDLQLAGSALCGSWAVSKWVSVLSK